MSGVSVRNSVCRSIEQALEGAQGKAAGLFPADVARVLLTARRVDWEMIRWIEAPEPKHFVAQLHQLGEQLLLLLNTAE